MSYSPSSRPFNTSPLPSIAAKRTPSIKHAAVDDAAHVIDLDHVSVARPHATGRGRRSGLDLEHVYARRPEALILRLPLNIIGARLDVGARISLDRRGARGAKASAVAPMTLRRSTPVVSSIARPAVCKTTSYTPLAVEIDDRDVATRSPTFTSASSRSLGAALAYFASDQSRSAENAYNMPPSAK